MTNDDSLDEIDNLFGEEFRRPITSEAAKLEELHTVACNLFGRKYRTSLKELEAKNIYLHQLIELLALIVGKTYVESGDSFQLADDEALMLIRDQLIKYSPFVIARNKKKRLSKGLFL